MNVCWLILCVMREYLESQENICSHISVSTLSWYRWHNGWIHVYRTTISRWIA